MIWFEGLVELFVSKFGALSTVNLFGFGIGVEICKHIDGLVVTERNIEDGDSDQHTCRPTHRLSPLIVSLDPAFHL